MMFVKTNKFNNMVSWNISLGIWSRLIPDQTKHTNNTLPGISKNTEAFELWSLIDDELDTLILSVIWVSVCQ